MVHNKENPFESPRGLDLSNYMWLLKRIQKNIFWIAHWNKKFQSDLIVTLSDLEKLNEEIRNNNFSKVRCYYLEVFASLKSVKNSGKKTLKYFKKVKKYSSLDEKLSQNVEKTLQKIKRTLQDLERDKNLIYSELVTKGSFYKKLMALSKKLKSLPLKNSKRIKNDAENLVSSFEKMLGRDKKIQVCSVKHFIEGCSIVNEELISLVGKFSWKDRVFNFLF